MSVEKKIDEEDQNEDTVESENDVENDVENIIDNDVIREHISLLLKNTGVKKKYRETLLSPKSMSFFFTACTHTSYDSENNLAFLHALGSATMNQTFVSYLIETYPTFTSAQITNMKKNFFKDSPNNIAEYAKTIGIDKIIMYNSKISVLTTKMIQKVFESIIGAIELIINKEYKEGVGFIVVRKICYFIYSNIHVSNENDSITILKELYQQQLYGHVQHVEFSKDENTNIFKIEIYDEFNSNKIMIGEGFNRQKAIAQDEASKQALIYFLKQGKVKKEKHVYVNQIDPLSLHYAPRNEQFTSFILRLLRQVSIVRGDIELNRDDMEIFAKAFTHPDVNPNPTGNFEVLETLGDNLANKCVLWYLSSRFPQLNGPYGIDIMTKMKINIIQTSGYSMIAQELGFLPFISAKRSLGVTETKKLLEDVFEATFAAIEIVFDRKYKLGFGFVVCYRLLSLILDKKEFSINYEEIVDARTRLKETLDLFKTIKIKYDKPIKNGFEYISSILESRFIENTDRFTPFYKIPNSEGKGDTPQEAQENAAKNAIEYYKSFGIVKHIPNEYLKFCI